MKKYIAILLIIVMALSLAACQETPEEVIVVKKDTERMIEQAGSEENGSKLSNLGIPKGRYTFNSEAAEGKLQIYVDANIRMPDTDKLPIRKASIGVFSQEIVTGIFNYLFHGEETFDRSGIRLTKADYERMILDYQQILANGSYIENDQTEEEILALIEAAEESYKTAPESSNEPLVSDGTMFSYELHMDSNPDTGEPQDYNAEYALLSVETEDGNKQLSVSTPLSSDRNDIIKSGMKNSLCYSVLDAPAYTTKGMQRTDGVSLYITCNPGGVGHTWVKRLFIDRNYNEGEDPGDYSFIQALPKDNTALLESNPDYIRALESLPPKLRKAWLEGSWDIFMGQFFEEFTDDPSHYSDRLWTHVIEPFEIPGSWALYRSFDWGFSKPFSCDWWAVDTDGRAYLILQLYGCTGVPDEGLKWSPDKVFSEVARIEREHRWLAGKHIRGVADSAIWASDGGEAIVEAAERHGVAFEKSDKTRIPGWMQMHYRLSFDETGRPMMYFFNTCRHAIRTLPLLQYSENQPEDLDTEGEDHFADSCRYFCMMRPIAARKNVKSNKPVCDPLDQFNKTNQTIYSAYNIRRF